MPDEPRTALGSAHERFVRSLPDRGRELHDLARRLQATPADARLSEQIGRRMHALYASAQVFQDPSLLDAVKLALDGIEAARLERRPPTPGEIDAALALCEWLAAEANPGEPGARENSAAGLAGESNKPWHSALSDAAPARASRPHDAPLSVPHSVAGTLPAPEVIAVLVIAGRDVERQVRAALPDERCELTTSAEPDTALTVIDQVSPDVVLIETGLLGPNAEEVVTRLRGARASGVRAVVAIVPEGATDVEALLGRTHADAVLRLPLPQSGLLDRLQRWSGRGVRSGGGLDVLNAGTVDEIARGVAEEIRRGVAGSLRRGRGERIDLGDKSDLLAATWSAVARIRASLSARADGRVRFDDAPFAGGPAALALTESEPAAPYVTLADALRDRRILLADDDPAVLWFFGNLLREAGAIAIEARNGKQALELARRRPPPDVVISDILMPEIDGFTLCRELQRDLSLAHVPVILLSWKEDFLQRMRELDSGATGYLRKEAGSHQILATVAEALRPRAELTALLAAGGEVQGRIEPLGVAVLLQTVASQRSDARVVVRDAWNLFDVDLRGGNTLAVTRTASDGSFARGQVALRQLLGVVSGRFSVVSAQGRARGAFVEPLDALIAEGLRQLGAVLDAVSDSRLMRVCRVTLDDEVLSSLLNATPTALVDVAARLRAGDAARDLVLTGWIAARELEQQLRELAQRGALIGVFGPDGEDLIDAARVARDLQPGALLHASDRPRRSSAPPTEVAEGEVEWMDDAAATLPDGPAASPQVEQPAREAAAAGESTELRDPNAPTRVRRVVEFVSQEEPFAVRSSRLHAHAPDPEAPPRATPQPDAPGRWRRERASFWLALFALAALGFAGMRWIQSSAAPAAPIERRSSTRGAQAARAEQPLAQAERAGTETSSSPAEQAAAAGAGVARAQVESGPGLGRVLPFIDRSRGVQVAANEGLLIVEHEASSTPPRVRVGERDLGLTPVATALPEGRHELVLNRDAQTSFRYVVIRAGETRIVEIRD